MSYLKFEEQDCKLRKYQNGVVRKGRSRGYLRGLEGKDYGTDYTMGVMRMNDKNKVYIPETSVTRGTDFMEERKSGPFPKDSETLNRVTDERTKGRRGFSLVKPGQGHRVLCYKCRAVINTHKGRGGDVKLRNSRP